jgi:hypothetical protein
MRTHGVHCLLMGGQACVFYGAAEFSRDTDLAILSSPDNLDCFRAALADLEAECIAVPPFQAEYLLRGHALRFRCHHPDAAGMRIDVMSIMRGVAPFDVLWARRTTIRATDGDEYDLLSLADLVQAKKTQRDEDWPMLRRLVEADYLQNRSHSTPDHLEFWLRELRTPVLLIELAVRHPDLAAAAVPRRPLLAFAVAENPSAVEKALAAEEAAEREVDRVYWQPLRAELEALRHRHG